MRRKINIHHALRPDAFLDEPRVITVRTIQEDIFEDFARDFSIAISSGQSVIPIMIDSFGGDVYTLFGMVSLMLSSPVPVATFSPTKAQSCGAVLLGMGTPGYRFAAPLATGLIHDVSNATQGKVTDVMTTANEMNRLNGMLFSLLDERCSKEQGFFLREIARNGHCDLYLSAQDMLSLGLVDYIGVPEFTVDVKVKWRVGL